MAILSGCGASSTQKAAAWQVIRTASFRFEAPAGWPVERTAGGAKASKDGDFVQVSTFPLARAYTPALFTRVEAELAARMAAVAQQAKGVVKSHRVVAVTGAKSHSFEIVVDGRTSRYTFVLRGKREFLLLCSADPDACDELAASFSAG